MKTLKKIILNESLITSLLQFYTHTLYTIIRIFVTIYGF
jgi:hypothetical protein